MSSSEVEPVRGRGSDLDRFLAMTDSSLGLLSIVARTTAHSARTTRKVASPLLRGAGRLPVVGSRARLVADRLHRHGSPVRRHVATTATTVIDRVVPVLVEQLLRRVDLTEVVRRHVDLDGLVADVDLDAVVNRLDLDAVAARLDVDAVAARLDVDAVLDRLDLTALALHRLDLATLVAAVLAQVDLAATAQQVIDAVDLPGIIRDSSGAVTSDAVRGARMRSAAADQAIGRVRDRLLLRRNGTRIPPLPAGTPEQQPPPLPPGPGRP